MTNVDLDINLEDDIIEQLLDVYIRSYMESGSHEVFERDKKMLGVYTAAGKAVLNDAIINALAAGIIADLGDEAPEYEICESEKEFENDDEPYQSIWNVRIDKQAYAFPIGISISYEDLVTHSKAKDPVVTYTKGDDITPLEPGQSVVLYQGTLVEVISEEVRELINGDFNEIHRDGEALDDAPIVENNITIHLNGEERDYPAVYKIDYDEIAAETGIEDPIVGWKYSDDGILEELSKTLRLVLTDGMIIVATAPHGMVEVTLNGEKRKYPAKQSITYDRIAIDAECYHPSITISSPTHGDSIMSPGQTVEVEVGMIINAYDTDNA